jgi:hypothetical protein
MMIKNGDLSGIHNRNNLHLKQIAKYLFKKGVVFNMHGNEAYKLHKERNRISDKCKTLNSDEVPSLPWNYASHCSPSF